MSILSFSFHCTQKHSSRKAGSGWVFQIYIFQPWAEACELIGHHRLAIGRNIFIIIIIIFCYRGRWPVAFRAVQVSRLDSAASASSRHPAHLAVVLVHARTNRPGEAQHPCRRLRPTPTWTRAAATARRRGRSTACVRRRRYLRRTSRSPSRPSRCPSSPTRCPRRPAPRSSTPAPARPSRSRRSCPGPARSLPRYAPVSASPRATSPCARPCSLRAPPEKSGDG